MKRVISLAICLFMMCICSVMASAEENGIYENAGQLYEAWVSQSGVPDYISGVWSTDGGLESMTFGVVKGEAGEKGQQEILALVKDDSTVTIVYQTYSRNYLYRVQEEIVDAYFEKGLGLVTAGLDEYNNKLNFEVHIDYANNADTLAMIERVTEQYGDAVSFSYRNTYPQLVTDTQPAVPTNPVLVMTNPQKQVMPIGFVFALCVIVLAFLFLIEMHRRRVMAVVTDGKPVVLEEPPISQKEIEEAIRKAEIQIPESLDNRVMQGYWKHNLTN